MFLPIAGSLLTGWRKAPPALLPAALRHGQNARAAAGGMRLSGSPATHCGCTSGALPPAVYALRLSPERGSPSAAASSPAAGVLRRPVNNCGCRSALSRLRRKPLSNTAGTCTVPLQCSSSGKTAVRTHGGGQSRRSPVSRQDRRFSPTAAVRCSHACCSCAKSAPVSQPAGFHTQSVLSPFSP